MAAFRERFNKAPPRRATLLDWEKRVAYWSVYGDFTPTLYKLNQNCDTSINSVGLLSMKFCGETLKGSQVVKFWQRDEQTQILGGEQAYFT
jgi:hypothetical protein